MAPTKHETFPIFHNPAVWPDVEIKVAQAFFRKLPKKES